MKLYTYEGAPNPRRVHMYLVERGIEDIEFVTKNIMARENRTPEFLETVNVMGGLHVLELDDGSHIPESVAICRYLEKVRPGPALFGDTPEGQAQVDFWLRRLELNFMVQVGLVWIHGSPITKVVNPNQIEAAANSARKTVGRYHGFLNEQLGAREYIAGDGFSMADIVALTTLEFGQDLNQLDYDTAALPHLAAWHDRVGNRPSATTTRMKLQ